MLDTDAAYWAGVIDSYKKEVTGSEIKLQSHADWRMVDALARVVDGTYTKRHRGSYRRGYDIWVVKVGDQTVLSHIINYMRIELL